MERLNQGLGFQLMHALDGSGEPVPVSVSDLGGGGGGMGPEDITANAPATWDAETATVGVAVGTSSGQVAAGDHSHTAAQVGAAPADHTHDYADLSGTPTIPSSPGDVGAAPASHTHVAGDLPTAEAVADVEDEADVATVAAQFNALLASLRGAGYLAGGG